MVPDPCIPPDPALDRLRAAYLAANPEEAREVIARHEPHYFGEEAETVSADVLDRNLRAIAEADDLSVFFVDPPDAPFGAGDAYDPRIEPRYLHFLLSVPVGNVLGIPNADDLYRLVSVSLREGVDFLDDLAADFGAFYIVETAE